MGTRARAVLLRTWRVPRVATSQSVSGTGSLSLASRCFHTAGVAASAGCFLAAQTSPCELVVKDRPLHRLAFGGRGSFRALTLCQTSPRLPLTWARWGRSGIVSQSLHRLAQNARENT